MKIKIDIEVSSKSCSETVLAMIRTEIQRGMMSYLFNCIDSQQSESEGYGTYLHREFDVSGTIALVPTESDIK